jgi:hypothetical protein
MANWVPGLRARRPSRNCWISVWKLWFIDTRFRRCKYRAIIILELLLLLKLGERSRKNGVRGGRAPPTHTIFPAVPTLG